MTTTHLCAAQGTLTLELNPPTAIQPGCMLPPSLPFNASSSHWPRRAAPSSIKNARVL